MKTHEEVTNGYREFLIEPFKNFSNPRFTIRVTQVKGNKPIVTWFNYSTLHVGMVELFVKALQVAMEKQHEWNKELQ
jgi:hypothetical protein